jgi:hypothetical protein
MNSKNSLILMFKNAATSLVLELSLTSVVTEMIRLVQKCRSVTKTKTLSLKYKKLSFITGVSIIFISINCTCKLDHFSPMEENVDSIETV